MFRSNSTVVRLDSTLSGTYTATNPGGTSAESTAAPISGALPRSPTPQSAEMDALLKEKPSMDEHDLEANPTGKPEAEGPAGADAKVRKDICWFAFICDTKLRLLLCLVFPLWFRLGMLCLYLTFRAAFHIYEFAVQYIRRAEEA